MHRYIRTVNAIKSLWSLVRQRADQIDMFTTEMSCLTIVWATIEGAQSSRHWSRARLLDQIPQMIEITHQWTQDWQPGSSIAVHASMRRLVAE